MKLLIVLPILIPFATAIVSLFVRRWILAQRILGVAGAAGLLGAALALFIWWWGKTRPGGPGKISGHFARDYHNVSVLVAEEYTERAVRALHAAYGLDAD